MTPTREEAERPAYLIRKSGAYYRPNERGYTTSAIQAGRYTLKDAEQITHPNGPDGPRDGMGFIHEDDVPDLDWRAFAALRERLEAAEACNRGLVRLNEATEARAKDLQKALTEARAKLEAAWQAWRDAAAGRAEQWLASAEENEIAFEKLNDLRRTWSGHSEAAHWIAKGIRALTPPTDATAALTAVQDAEWNAALMEVATLANRSAGTALALLPEIHALRRNPKEGE